MRPIDKIIVHCSATSNGSAYVATDIDWWHRHREFVRDPEARNRFNKHFSSIGYHFVIRVNGELETGRHESEVGAHTQDHNSNSIGICLIGTDKFTPAAWAQLATLVEGLLLKYKRATVHGHREYAPKLCPGFDVQSWVRNGFEPLEAHVCKEI